jgi:hypothetical protein
VLVQRQLDLQGPLGQQDAEAQLRMFLHLRDNASELPRTRIGRDVYSDKE